MPPPGTKKLQKRPDQLKGMVSLEAALSESVLHSRFDLSVFYHDIDNGTALKASTTGSSRRYFLSPISDISCLLSEFPNPVSSLFICELPCQSTLTRRMSVCPTRQQQPQQMIFLYFNHFSLK